jgi:hypothetical protein
MACNPSSNIITPKPFYVEHLHKLGDDQSYLKSTLWPMLKALFDAANVEEFRRQFPPLLQLPLSMEKRRSLRKF